MSSRAYHQTASKAVALVVVMGSLAWASVPFYDWFCRTTGFGGVPSIVEADSEVILERTMKVRFDASLERGMPWEFTPVEREMELRIGETGLAFYEAYNPTDRPVAGSASYNVTPYEAGGFFNKIACFCFEEQILQPGERVQMPVTFYIDPELAEDRAQSADHGTLARSLASRRKASCARTQHCRQASGTEPCRGRGRSRAGA